MKYILFLSCIVILLFSCTYNNDTQNAEVKSVEQNFKLVQVDSIFFRRAYHGQDTLEGREWDLFVNRNPEWCSGDADIVNRSTYKGLVNGEIILDGNLNLSKIDTLPEHFEYQFSPDRIFKVETRLLEDPKTVATPSYELTFLEKEKVLLIDTLEFGFPPDVTFMTRDLNSDGKHEIITIFKWYIVNGDNFDMTIYEIK